MQVIPQGQSVSQSYEMEYHLLNGPDSTTKYSLNDGPPLYLQKTIDDNVISEGETTPVNVQIINPAGRTLRGQIRINREIGFDNKKTLSTIDYELPPETYKEVNITFKSDSLHDGKTELPTESHITVENEIHSSEYHALYSSQQGVGGDTMTVRKHLFDRFGFKWLILLGLATIAALTWRLRRHLQ